MATTNEEEPFITNSATAPATSENNTASKSSRWLLFALLAAASFGLGNVAFGLHCSQRGIFGASFTGPAGLLILTVYRMVTQARVKLTTGFWVDKNNSNYYVPLVQ